MIRHVDFSKIGNIDSRFKEPFFRLEDLDLNENKNHHFIPGSHIEPERLTSIYQQAFIYDLLYKFAKEYLPDVKDSNKNKEVRNASIPSEKDQATDTTIDNIKEKVIEYLFNKNIKVEVPDTNVQNEKEASSIWNNDDLNILRKNTENIKGMSFSMLN